ncbi:MAG TPA: TusE/DsrC/DsvC family sulfur relay protein [Marinobacterium sp.]|nr:TusE/DsrC/DsvC family sulfur relay protein [Marinobacterium sp.]
MAYLRVGGQPVPLDPEGYLANLTDWSKAVAEALAQEESLELSDAHWELIELVRRFYAEFDHSPAMRPLVKYIGLHLGKEKARSIYLMQLLPANERTGSPPKRLARIAGLPKPDNCL